MKGKTSPPHPKLEVLQAPPLAYEPALVESVAQAVSFGSPLNITPGGKRLLVEWYVCRPNANCFKLFEHWLRRAASRAA